MTKLLASTYRQEDCKIGVVHVGFGAFHRAHQAYYFDTMMEITGDLSWGIAAINLRTEDAETFARTQKKGGYVLKTVAKDGTTEFQLIRSHLAYADWSAIPESAEIMVAASNVKLITITVTEGGYYMDEDGYLNSSDPVLVAEYSCGSQVTVYGYLRSALNRRRDSGAGPITIMNCDNLRHNGRLLSQNLRQYLTLCEDLVLLEWLDSNVTFPCSMVDRITPKPTQETSLSVASETGRLDDPSVLAEDFIQWVIEDSFAGEKPAFETAGALLVNKVEPYEDTKIRILNGGHTGLVYLGALSGYSTFDQIMADNELHGHFTKYETCEVIPALGEDMPVDLTQYLQIIQNRFQNRFIADTVERICMDGVSKFPIFILPTIEQCYHIGIQPTYGIRSVASWYVFVCRVSDGTLPISYIDQRYEILAPFIENKDPIGFAYSDKLWGDIPKRVPDFPQQILREIENLETKFPTVL